MTKESYDIVELEIVRFEGEDVIVTSICNSICQDTGPVVP